MQHNLQVDVLAWTGVRPGIVSSATFSQTQRASHRSFRAHHLCALLVADREAVTYQVSAIAATAFIGTIAITATYLRFHWHLEVGGWRHYACAPAPAATQGQLPMHRSPYG